MSNLVPAEAVARPADSKLVVTEAPDGVTVIVPPQHGYGCLTLFDVIVVGFMVFVTVIGVQGKINVDEDQPRPASAAQVTVLLGIGWTVAVGWLLYAIHTGRRQVVVAVVGDQLLVLQTSPIRTT